MVDVADYCCSNCSIVDFLTDYFDCVTCYVDLWECCHLQQNLCWSNGLCCHVRPKKYSSNYWAISDLSHHTLQSLILVHNFTELELGEVLPTDQVSRANYFQKDWFSLARDYTWQKLESSEFFYRYNHLFVVFVVSIRGENFRW